MQPYYERNGITIYHGDCLEVMPTLAAQSFDAIITDPPYGTTACAWDTPIPFAPMWAELRRLIRPRAAIVLFGSQPFTSALVMSNPGWFRYEWVWEKQTLLILRLLRYGLESYTKILWSFLPMDTCITRR